jgi:hypothetical protein
LQLCALLLNFSASAFVRLTVPIAECLRAHLRSHALTHDCRWTRSFCSTRSMHAPTAHARRRPRPSKLDAAVLVRCSWQS